MTNAHVTRAPRGGRRFAAQAGRPPARTQPNEAAISTTRLGTPARANAGDRARVVALLLDYLERFRVHFFETAERHGLTPMQAKAIWLLEGPRPMSGVAECLSCDPSNITGVVDRLQERGLAVREEGAKDRRVKQLRLTAEGVKLRNTLIADLHANAPGVDTLSGEELAMMECALRALLR